MRELYVHSACCNAHWELVTRNGEYVLECEECHKSIGGGFKIQGPDLSKCSCGVCGKE